MIRQGRGAAASMRRRPVTGVDRDIRYNRAALRLFHLAHV
jgi:hypothetical protein